MRGMEPNSVDAIVTDPPAGIAFMNKSWDKNRGGRNQWIEWMAGIARECLRVLKPGGYALVWALPRTSHWTATAWEDAGFEVRDRIAHIFGSGFPKSLDVSKQIDKAAGKEREIVGKKTGRSATPINKIASNSFAGGHGINGGADCSAITAPATDAARQWDGWGTALKPAMEDWWLLRKPLSEKTVAANVQKWGTGAINVDGCRIGSGGPAYVQPRPTTDAGGGGSWKKGEHIPFHYGANGGRWPANLIHDGSEEVLELFPHNRSRPGNPDNIGKTGKGYSSGNIFPRGLGGKFVVGYYDAGSAARFFYCAKASRAEREAGLNGELHDAQAYRSIRKNRGNGYPESTKTLNHHPTVKPLALMRYLVRLVTPPNGTILDPFMGSGTTGMAAKQEGFEFIGIEKEKEYVDIAERRIEATV